MDAELVCAPAGTLVVQIGASSGREVAHFAQCAPGLHFLGTDIDKKIIDRASATYMLLNLDFSVGPAHQLMRHLPAAGDIILHSNGSLQYVSPEQLAMTFNKIKARRRVTINRGAPMDNHVAETAIATIGVTSSTPMITTTMR